MDWGMLLDNKKSLRRTTGFTQIRHTLYIYYILFFLLEQRQFFTTKPNQPAFLCAFFLLADQLRFLSIGRFPRAQRTPKTWDLLHPRFHPAMKCYRGPSKHAIFHQSLRRAPGYQKKRSFSFFIFPSAVEGNLKRQTSHKLVCLFHIDMLL